MSSLFSYPDQNRSRLVVRSSIFLAALTAVGLLAGCVGGYFNGSAQSRLVLHAASMTPESNSRTEVAFRISGTGLPFKFSDAAPSTKGTLLYLTSPYNWGGSVFFLPPLGLFPRRPPKPIFIVRRGTQEFYIGPDEDSADLRLNFDVRNLPSTSKFLQAEYHWSPSLSYVDPIVFDFGFALTEGEPLWQTRFGGPHLKGGWQADVVLPARERSQKKPR